MLFEDFLCLEDEDQILFCRSNRQFDNQILDYLISYDTNKNLEQCLSDCAARTEDLKLLDKITNYKNKTVLNDSLNNPNITLEILQKIKLENEFDKRKEWYIVKHLDALIDLKECTKLGIEFDYMKHQDY